MRDLQECVDCGGLTLALVDGRCAVCRRPVDIVKVEQPETGPIRITCG